MILSYKGDQEKAHFSDEIWAAATKNRRKGWLREMMRAIFSPDSKLDFNDINVGLLLETRKGNADEVLALLVQGADVNAADCLGFTALMGAVESGNAEIARILLERGADVNAADVTGCTAVNIAAEAEKLEMVQLLLEQGANVDALVLNDKLVAAAKAGKWGTVWALLEQGVDIQAEYDGENALFAATAAGRIDIAAALLDKGADVNVSDGGRNALSIAMKASRGEMVRLLLDRGAEVSQRELDEYLIDAAEAGQLDLVKALLAHGANGQAQDYYCRGTALHVATDRGYDDIAAILRDAGAAAQTEPSPDGKKGIS